MHRQFEDLRVKREKRKREDEDDEDDEDMQCVDDGGHVDDGGKAVSVATCEGGNGGHEEAVLPVKKCKFAPIVSEACTVVSLHLCAKQAQNSCAKDLKWHSEVRLFCCSGFTDPLTRFKLPKSGEHIDVIMELMAPSFGDIEQLDQELPAEARKNCDGDAMIPTLVPVVTVFRISCKDAPVITSSARRVEPSNARYAMLYVQGQLAKDVEL